MFDFVYFLP